jgi:hypothetical protein
MAKGSDRYFSRGNVSYLRTGSTCLWKFPLQGQMYVTSADSDGAKDIYGRAQRGRRLMWGAEHL